MKKSLLVVGSLLFILGCEESRLTDFVTQETPMKVEMKPDFIAVENDNDGMARSNLEYISKDRGKIAVDPNFFKQNEMHRGDIIYYQTPEIDKGKYPNLNPPVYSISRIIALPGEELEIKKGQIYVNHKRLDTFYGKALSWGLGEKAYFKSLNSPGSEMCDDACKSTMKSYFNKDLASVKIPVDHLFVMGDTWARSIDSLVFGTLPTDRIKGKVLGYAKVE
ncbi:signal peptidase I [Paenibacillus pectinilyticus]|uniref:Signal peptidase I n=1 Tax=Paenibacillus pectinilyticus TaxID=512399 RepID=A0A1C0ZZ86_9BACL|nr:signal peptidase I [Paenibacillus pectinilyticus]OCT13438.1 signal peptidase I [Paenibacillus pectinilyticus]